MRKIGIRYYNDLLTEENFIAMAEGGMTATELCCVREPEKLDFKRVWGFYNNAMETFAWKVPSKI